MGIAGQTVTATVPVTVRPIGSCQIEVFLGVSRSNKAASSGLVAFNSTESLQNVACPITLPSAGTYHVYVDLYYSGVLILSTQDADVVVGGTSTLPGSIEGTLPKRLYGQVADNSGIAAFPYYKSGVLMLHVEDGSGARELQFPEPVPDLSFGDTKVTLYDSVLTLFWGTYPPKVSRYSISNLSLIENREISSGWSWLLTAGQTRNGKQIAVWTSTDKPSDGLYVYFTYRNSSGVWITLPRITLHPITPTAKATLCQHPADGSVWCFFTADGKSSILAAHLTESGETLSIDWVAGGSVGTEPASTPFIPYISGNQMTPEGEWPHITSVADPSSNSILIAYQNLQYKFFSTTAPIRKGAYIAVVKVKADRSKSLLFVLQQYVERLSVFSLGISGSQPWLAYGVIDPSTLTYDDLYFYKESARLLGRTAPPQHPYYPLCHSSNTVIAGMNDGRIHFYPIG